MPRHRDSSGPQAPSASGALVKPVMNATHILDLLSRSERPMTLTEIVRALGINPSTGLAILRTLVAVRLVAVEAKSKSYYVGTGLIALAEGVLRREATLEVLRPAMTRLASKFGITVVFWEVMEDEHLRLAAFALSDADIRIQMRIGQRLPIWAGAVGRLVAGQSGLPPFALRRKFARVRWQDPPTFDTYRRESVGAARHGYALDDGNFLRGVLSIAAPIFSSAGKITMACNAVAFSGQLPPKTIRQIAQELIELSRIAESALPAR